MDFELGIFFFLLKIPQMALILPLVVLRSALSHHVTTQAHLPFARIPLVKVPVAT